MKAFSASFLTILLAATTPLPLLAQEPANGFGLAPATPAKTESLMPDVPPGGLPLIPEPIPMPETGKKGKAEKPEKQSKTSAAEDALRDLIKLRVAKTKAQSDPELQALWDTTYKARTDYEQRQIMTKYYTLLCERISKVDKTLKQDLIDSIRYHYISSYDQTHVAPTVPPAWATPVTTPAPKAKKKQP